MPATTFATVASPQMVLFCKYIKAILNVEQFSFFPSPFFSLHKKPYFTFNGNPDTISVTLSA